ncbi:ABC transporter ATP-binding protein [Phytoactinopolyspora mesophila]|uniref:Dipeptide ABC transporter ATP-binding protein n=1 Tax=Phytoactinopolyspora mesophila TaxID=2650750 RepID=A0A7K3M7G8_9ACTN|nr:dipeptide ABC transporter ATP-binding protein [Phytoactinopolyspora mesophila]NDL59259.1 dipeptide ABC transporter ATP-binding protein [Phytoactinopolyspora mesophila]
MSEPLLKVEGLVKQFPIGRKLLGAGSIDTVKAVDGVSFDLARGETLGIVGESGCGKSTVAKTLVRLEEPTAGTAMFEGEDIFSMSAKRMRKLRREVQIIFQDPYGSLNPRMTVGDIITEAWEIHRDVVTRRERKKRAQDLLERVGLDPGMVNRYPHQFSGGQRQRVGIARALTLQPKIIICDEPVSALDVSVQAQVMNLLEEIQDDFGLSYIFIAHDLSVVRHISDRVGVMYLGRIVELGNEDSIYENATHPYTQALLSAVPNPDPDESAASKANRIVLEGDVPSPVNPPSGCNFRTRCWKADERCAEEDPDLLDRFNHGHPSACHYAEVRQAAI